MDKNYIAKLAKRAKQRARLLVSRPDFQEEILELRKRHRIPLGGFTDDETNQKWHNDFYESDDVWFKTEYPKHTDKLLKLKNEGNLREYEKLNREINNSAPVNSFRIAIKNMLKKYKVPLRWEECVRRYLLFNDLDNMWLPAGISIHGERDKDTNLERLFIEIEDDTILEDIKQQWQEIKYQQKQLHSHTKDKFQPIKQYDRDKMADDLKRKGYKLADIAKKLSKEFHKDYSWYDVSKFIERYRQKLGIN